MTDPALTIRELACEWFGRVTGALDKFDLYVSGDAISGVDWEEHQGASVMQNTR